MQTRLTLKPGQKGTRKLAAQYGERLVCVRYRYDTERKRRYKTVELIVEEMDWEPSRVALADDARVAIRVAWDEAEVRQQVKQAGGRWVPEKKVWEMRYDQVKRLGLEERIVKGR